MNNYLHVFDVNVNVDVDVEICSYILNVLIKSTIGDKIREELIKGVCNPKHISFIVETYYDGDYEMFWENR